MKQSTYSAFASTFLMTSAFSILSVSLAAFFSPQTVMDLVQVELQNNDALSSIRGVYGGVGLSLFLLLIYFYRNDQLLGLKFLSILWGLYALSRLITIVLEGSLGQMGNTWLIMEAGFFTIALWLVSAGKKYALSK